MRGASWGERGQSTIEYMLIVIIVVILILSLLYQFQSSFRNYAETFFDGYIRCLLETGELPGTGSICPQAFTTFDAKSGKGLLKENLPVGANNGKGGGKGDQRKTSPKGGETVSRGGGGGGSSTVGRFGGGNARSTVVGTVSGGGDTSVDQLGSQLQMGNGTTVGRLSSSGRRTMSTVETSGAAPDEDPKKPKAAPTKKKAVGNESLKPVKVVEKLDRKPAKAYEDNSQTFSVGGMIRLLIIILIIVAMVVFFGGQLLQISKSREKGGD